MLNEEFDELLQQAWDEDIKKVIIEMQKTLKSYKMFATKSLLDNIKTIIKLANDTKTELEALKKIISNYQV
jgi:tRNA C32,U32 (ribose-2'-O)-methylase TrmJ